MLFLTPFPALSCLAIFATLYPLPVHTVYSQVTFSL